MVKISAAHQSHRSRTHRDRPQQAKVTAEALTELKLKTRW